MNALAVKAAACFAEKFSARPGIWFSPGRINLIGEHIDYNDGYVMPAAIDKGIYYALAPNNSDQASFYAVDFNEVFSVNIRAVEKNEGWKNYVLGVMNEFLLLDKPLKGFDCALTGDIPQGAGMSSSAAAEAGLAFALNELFDCGLNRTELALLCQRAEHNYPGVQCGIMDMYASLHGRKDHVLLLDCKNITHEYFPLQLEGYKIVLLNTKVHHTLASGEYNVRRKRCEEGLAILKKNLHINSFRDIKSVADVELHKSKMTAEAYNCCKYVAEEIARTKKAALLLQQKDIEGFGKLMYATHEGLSKLYDVSCPESDLLVELAGSNKYVIGARQMGGGFGGCTINIIREEGINDFIEQAGTVYRQQFNIEPGVYVMETGDGTRRMDIPS